MSVATQIHPYDRAARAFHWVMAALILVLFASGLLFEALPKDIERTAVTLHISFGAITLALLVLRIVWRATHAAPPLAAGTPPLMVTASKLGHLALYAGMAGVMVAGLAAAFTRGHAVNLLLFSIPSPMAADRALVRPATEIHELFAYGLIALVVAHVAAAVWHQVVLRDGTMLRMSPRGQ